MMFYSRMQIKALHQYDCLRANKSTSAWGLEARVPFLDKEFINVAMAIDPEWKMVLELTFNKLGLDAFQDYTGFSPCFSIHFR
jgi:asparagine synthetase B (glutamine-hydrolysing)